jgi:hypothetical protein
MRTGDGTWTVEVLTTRGGQVFRVRRLGMIRSDRGWGPIGQLRLTVDEVRDLLGDAFADLEPVENDGRR